MRLAAYSLHVVHLMWYINYYCQGQACNNYAIIQSKNHTTSNTPMFRTTMHYHSRERVIAGCYPGRVRPRHPQVFYWSSLRKLALREVCFGMEDCRGTMEAREFWRKMAGVSPIKMSKDSLSNCWISGESSLAAPVDIASCVSN